MTVELTLTRPDDFHLHLRDGAVLADTVKASARYFGRAIIMPNLIPPVTTTQSALEYEKRIRAVIPEDSAFTPLMTLYLTNETSQDEVKRAKASGSVHALKLYPAGATTNSDAGVTVVEKIYPVLEAMIEEGLPLLVHGEVTDSHIDIFDREKAFIDRHLATICQRYPELRVVMEHITTKDAVDFVRSAPEQVAATITPQHLLHNRNDLLAGGLRPHLYCLPVLKRHEHQKALIEAAVSGNPKFFLGTDSAPHARHKKESACGCAGCFSASHALELYAEVFEDAGKLDRLEGFASQFGARFYGLPINTDTITLRKISSDIPHHLPLGNDMIIPLHAGQMLRWSVLTDV